MIERRGVYIMAARGTYSGKPRPVIAIQNPDVQLDSVIVLPLTTTVVDAPALRIKIEPTASNGLRQSSYVMCDKITAVAIANLGNRIGHISSDEMQEIERALNFLLRTSEDFR